MKKLSIFIFLFLNILVLNSQAQGHLTFPLSASGKFMENKGQIADQNNNQRNDVKFVGIFSNFKIILKKNSFSYELFRRMENDSETVHISRIDYEFIGAEKHPEIIQEAKSNEFMNFFLRNHLTGIEKVYSYDKITYKNLYKGIDLVFYASANGQLKYDFIINPGAKPSDVKISIKTDGNIRLNNNELEITTKNGKISENIPSTYQLLNGQKKEIKCRYVLSGNSLHYTTDNYDKSSALIIDPTVARAWGTFYGGSSWDFGNSVKLNSSGRLIIGGLSDYSSMNTMATSGAYQISCKGAFDCFIAEFNTSGQRIWGTYFGRSDNEGIEMLDIDSQGNIITCGYTESADTLSSSGSHQENFGGGVTDAFVAKFNSTGSLIWSTYYGGSGDEVALDLLIDQNDDIVICGYTGSNCIDTIASAGSWQSTFGGSTEDGFLAKFSPNGIRQWGTYYGGNGKDRIHGCAKDAARNIYITGETTSTNGMATSTSYQVSFGGVADGFVAKLNPQGSRIWGSYFGGSQLDKGFDLVLTSNNDLLITGNSSSTSGIATTGAYQTTHNGSGDVFIEKFDTSFTTRYWGTYFGGTLPDNPNDIKVDVSDNIILTGHTRSLTGMANMGAHQETFGGNFFDGFVAKFSALGFRRWCTLYGGSDDDQIMESVQDLSGFVYSIGETYSSNNISSTGAFQTLRGGSSDAVLIKLEEVSINVTPFSGPLCAGSSVPVTFSSNGNFGPTNTFHAELSDASGSFSNPVVIGTITNSGAGTINAIIPANTPGGNFYRIRVKSVDRGVADTDNGSNIVIYPLPVVTFSFPLSMCINAPTIPLPGVIPGGQPTGGTFSGPGVDGQGNFDPSIAGIGSISLCYTYTDIHSCSTQVVCTPVTINPPPTASIATIPTICLTSAPITLTQGSPPGGIYSGPGITSSTFDPSVTGTGNFTITYIYSDLGGCYDTAYQTITVASCTGIEEKISEYAFEVYPNPDNTDFLTIYRDKKINGGKCVVLNSIGQIVDEFVLQNSPYTINISTYVNGLYQINYFPDSGPAIRKKVIIQR